MRSIENNSNMKGNGMTNMRKKYVKSIFLIPIIFLLSLAGCEKNTNKENNTLPNDSSIVIDNSSTTEVEDTTIWENLSERFFAYGYSRNELLRFFKNNGAKVTSDIFGNEDEVYTIKSGTPSMYNAISYCPNQDIFIIGSYRKEELTIGNIVYVYEYTSSSKSYYYQPLTNSEFIGSYQFAEINTKTYNVNNAIEMRFNYSLSLIGDGYKLPDYNKVTTRKTGYNDENNISKYVYNYLTLSWEYAHNIFVKIKNENITGIYNKTDFSSIDLNKISFQNSKVKYDNQSHSIIANNVPDGIRVDYSPKDVVKPGEYTIKARFYDPKNNCVGEKEAKLVIDDLFDVSIKYMYGDIELGRYSGKLHYGDSLNEFAKENIPEGYKLNETVLSWSGFENQTLEVQVLAEMEGYMKVMSDTNQYLNNKYIPVEVITHAYQSSEELSLVPYGDTHPVSFYIYDIKSIEFCNSLDFDCKFLNKTSLFTNLESVDISNMKYLKEIPNCFFDGCKKLTTVTAVNMNYLTRIGGYFLKDTNIINFNFDLSNVEYIGRNFMHNALCGTTTNTESRTITIDLPSLKQILYYNSNNSSCEGGEVYYPHFLFQNRNHDNVKVNLILYDFVVTDFMFGCWSGEYVLDSLDLPGEHVYYSKLNLDIYTNKVSEQINGISKLTGSIQVYQTSKFFED